MFPVKQLVPEGFCAGLSIQDMPHPLAEMSQKMSKQEKLEVKAQCRQKVEKKKACRIMTLSYLHAAECQAGGENIYLTLALR